MATVIRLAEAIREGFYLSDSSIKLYGPRYNKKIHKKKPKWKLCSMHAHSKHSGGSFKLENRQNFQVYSSLVANPAEAVATSSEQKVYDVVLKQAALVNRELRPELDVKLELSISDSMNVLKEAYDRCGDVCEEYAKTFYLGTLLMTHERRRAIWAIYVWCRRTDELVDGPNASHITPSALDRWESRLEDLFAGHPYDMLDAALSDTVAKFPVDIQAYFLILGVFITSAKLYRHCPNHLSFENRSEYYLLNLNFKLVLFNFRKILQVASEFKGYSKKDNYRSFGLSSKSLKPFKDMVQGMRMDLKKSRYKNFDELYLYCYYVAGTVGLMSVPVMGIAPESKATTESVYNAALALGIANQLTNILRDVGEDARRGRIYLPQDELAQYGLSDDDIFNGRVNDKWRGFMRSQIERARMFFQEAEKGVTELSQASRWPVWASLLLYRQILDEIEANDYNNFTKRAHVSKAKKLMALPIAYGRSLIQPYSVKQASLSKSWS